MPFVKGQSGNPAGRRKQEAAVQGGQAIANNNAETMAPAPAQAAPPVATAPTEPAAIENNNGNTMDEESAPGEASPRAADTRSHRHNEAIERPISLLPPLASAA
jgi:hypothetical protein